MGSTTVRGATTRILAALRSRFAGRSFPRVDPVILGLVVVIGVVAVAAHAAYCDHFRARFASIYHDRNAHYQAGVNVACELRQGHLLTAIRDLDSGSMAWPVFHPACLAAVLTVAGPKPEAAVLPSLLGWCASTLLAFLIVRRIAGPYGLAGGLVTGALFLGSPALQALATDVMLESLGLCLTLAAILAYLVFAKNPTRRSGIVLGVVLSCLFLHKYNYWGIAVVALAATEVARRPGAILRGARDALGMVDWCAWLGAQLRRPLNYPIAILLGITAASVFNGGFVLEVFGLRWGVQNPRIYLYAAYALILLRLAVWWWPAGRVATARVAGEPAVALLTWAVIPVQVWFLLPHRLSYFLWYAGPGNAPAGLARSLPDSLGYYSEAFAREYHAAAILAAVMAAAAFVGVLAVLVRRQPATGWFVVPAMFTICGTLTVLHPNQQLRFLHTWAPLVWVMAGVGVAGMLTVVAGLANDRIARGVGVALIAGLTVAQVQLTLGFARVSPALGRGYNPAAVSLRDIHDTYLPLIDGETPTAIFCNHPDASWRWPFMERYGHKNGLSHNMREVGAFDPVTLAGAAKWVESTGCRTVVYFEIPRTSPLYEPNPTPADNSAIRAAMRAQTRFAIAHRIRLSNLGTVWVWKR
jgi:hypothetical protein